MKRLAPHRVARDSRRSGFTLIELLVVVAIIALLISILLPSLSRARQQAKQTVCMANLRSIGQAFIMYADQFNGLWPPVVDQMAEQNRWPVPFYKSKIISQELNQYDDAGAMIHAGGPSVFLCPAELAPRSISNWNGTSHTVDRVEVGGSFAYSAELHRNASDPYNPNGLIMGSPTTPPFMNPISHCKRPSEVFALLENYKPLTVVNDHGWRFNAAVKIDETPDAFFAGYRTWGGAAAPPQGQSVRVIGGRHLTRTNALAVDSHVEVQVPEKISYNQVSWTRWDQWPTLPPGGQ